jgi:hypothetical protein
MVFGKLYLNYNASVHAEWGADRANLIVAGHRNWPVVIKNSGRSPLKSASLDPLCRV